jgi:membrane-associated phospholipid phosphatase
VVTLGLCALAEGDKHLVVTNGLPRALARRLDPAERYGLRLTLFAVALALVGIPFGFLIAQIKDNGPLVRADTYAANHLHGWVADHGWAEDAFRVLSFLAVPPFVYLLMGGAAVYWWALRGHRRLGLYLLLTGWVGGLVDTAVKVVVDRERPSLVDPIATAHGKSFPSGHTMAATYGFGALLLAFLPVIPRRWRVPAFGAWLLMVALVAFARLGLGVHYITDVVGGFVLGLAWLAASTAAFSIWRVERGRRPVEPTEGLEPEVARH